MNEYYWDMLYSEPHIQHHGIQGQKWGVQNGPPYPLGRDVYSLLSSASSDRDYYTLLKAMQKDYKNSNGQYSKEQFNKDVKTVRAVQDAYRNGKSGRIFDRKETAQQMAKYKLEALQSYDKAQADKNNKTSATELVDKADWKSDSIVACKNAYENYINAMDKQVDYLDSKQADIDAKKAWDDTKAYMAKEYKPEYDEIVAAAKRDYGDKYEQHLDAYHDFRKMYDGFLDEAWTKGAAKYESTAEYKAQIVAAEKAKKEYTNAVDRAANELVKNNGGNADAKAVSKELSTAVIDDYYYLKKR